MILRLTMEKAIGGYWDGGAKSRFDWSIKGCMGKDAKGEYVKVGSWEANHWFHVARGKTDKQTLGNARRHLGTALKRNKLAHKFEYIKE